MVSVDLTAGSIVGVCYRNISFEKLEKKELLLHFFYYRLRSLSALSGRRGSGCRLPRRAAWCAPTFLVIFLA